MEKSRSKDLEFQLFKFQDGVNKWSLQFKADEGWIGKQNCVFWQKEKEMKNLTHVSKEEIPILSWFVYCKNGLKDFGKTINCHWTKKVRLNLTDFSNS